MGGGCPQPGTEWAMGYVAVTKGRNCTSGFYSLAPVSLDWNCAVQTGWNQNLDNFMSFAWNTTSLSLSHLYWRQTTKSACAEAGFRSKLRAFGGLAVGLGLQAVRLEPGFLLQDLSSASYSRSSSSAAFPKARLYQNAPKIIQWYFPMWFS